MASASIELQSMSHFIDFCKKVEKYLENSHKNIPIVLGCFLWLLVSYVDYLVPSEISLSIFYLLPISLISWFVSQEAGFLTAVLSAIAWFMTNFSIQPKGSNLLIHPWNAFTELIVFLIVSYLVFQLRSVLHRVKESARIDSITGVANKRLFFELARLELKKSHRYRHPLTMVHIDIDDFKTVYEDRGDRVGEKILQTVAKSLKHHIRETDILGRIGSDEFVILLPGSGYEPAHVVINRVQKQLLQAMQRKKWSITFSISAVTFLSPPKSVDTMLQRTDRLMYSVKNNGKNDLKHITSV